MEPIVLSRISDGGMDESNWTFSGVEGTENAWTDLHINLRVIERNAQKPAISRQNPT